MLNHAFPQVRPASISVGATGEDIGCEEVGAKVFGDERPAHELGDGEGLEEGELLGDEGELGVEVDTVEEVVLLVVVGGEDNVVDYALEGLEGLVAGLGGREGTNTPQLVLIIQNHLRIIDGAIVLARIQILAILLRQLNLLIIELELQVGHIVVLNVLCRDLAGQDSSLCPVALLYAKLHLLENKVRLLPPVHGAEGLDLELAEDAGRAGEVALGFLDVREDAGDAGTFDFDENLFPSAS